MVQNTMEEKENNAKEENKPTIKETIKVHKKEIIIGTFVVLFGASLTVMSFCVYYLVKPSTGVLITICAIDWLNCLFNTCLFLKFVLHEKGWLFKASALSAGYIPAFILVASLFFTIGNAIEFLKNSIIAIILFAFFTAPSIFIVLAIGALLLVALSYGA